MKKSELIAKVKELRPSETKTDIKVTIETLEEVIKDTVVDEYPQGRIKLSIGSFYLGIDGYLRFSPAPKTARELKERVEAGEHRQQKQKADEKTQPSKSPQKPRSSSNPTQSSLKSEPKPRPTATQERKPSREQAKPIGTRKKIRKGLQK